MLVKIQLASILFLFFLQWGQRWPHTSAIVAQMEEHSIRNAAVVGSIPTIGSMVLLTKEPPFFFTFS